GSSPVVQDRPLDGDRGSATIRLTSRAGGPFPASPDIGPGTGPRGSHESLQLPVRPNGGPGGRPGERRRVGPGAATSRGPGRGRRGARPEDPGRGQARPGDHGQPDPP